MTFDLYVWSAPRDLDAARAGAIIESWHEAGGDPAASPFEPSTDVGWFCRELLGDAPDLEIVSDAVPRSSTTPIWLTTTQEAPARLVAIRLSPLTPRDAMEAITGLAAKYDLLLYDARNRRLHAPLQDLAAYASATFWPAGAVQAAVAGGIGLLIAVAAWMISIPLLSGLLVVVGGFLFVMAVYTFVHEGRIALRRRAGRNQAPPAT